MTVTVPMPASRRVLGTVPASRGMGGTVTVAATGRAPMPVPGP